MNKEELDSQNSIKPFRKVNRRKFRGVVVKDAMDKTIVVNVDRVKTHKKYFKQFKVSKKYKVHDPQNQYHIGDKVEFIECRPISKEKKWKVVNEEKKK